MVARKPAATSHLGRLYTLRDQLTVRLKADDGKLTAQLSRQLRETLNEIAALEKLQPRKSVVDELGRRRNSRRARSTKGAASAGGDS